MVLHVFDVEFCEDVVERDDSCDGRRVGVKVCASRSEVANCRRLHGPLRATLGVPEWHPFDEAE